MHWTQFALIAICMFAFWQRESAISRVAAVFLVNALVVSMWAWLVDPNINPFVQFTADFVSALFIMRRPALEMHGWFGMILGVRMGATLHYLVNGGTPSDLWSLMNYAGQVMMILLFIWSETHGGKLAGLCDRAGQYFVYRYSRV